MKYTKAHILCARVGAQLLHYKNPCILVHSFLLETTADVLISHYLRTAHTKGHVYQISCKSLYFPTFWR